MDGKTKWRKANRNVFVWVCINLESCTESKSKLTHLRNLLFIYSHNLCTVFIFRFRAFFLLARLLSTQCQSPDAFSLIMQIIFADWASHFQELLRHKKFQESIENSLQPNQRN